MLILSLAAVARRPVRLQARIPVDDPLITGAGIALKKPLQVDLEARAVGDGVLVRGQIASELEAGCRRCLVVVPVTVSDAVDLLFEALTAEEEAELSGEVYPLPARGDQLDLWQAIREHLVVRIPEYVVCSESCRGLCPRCGADLNRGRCGCAPEAGGDPWEALKEIKFD